MKNREMAVGGVRLQISIRGSYAGVSAACLLALAAVVGAVAAPAIARGQSSAAESSLATGDAMHGWRVFDRKHCADCHAIWGQGGTIGPDLGRLRSSRFSRERLAGILWNHLPPVLSRTRLAGRPADSLTAGDIEHLFSLMTFVRQVDEPGRAAEGRRLLEIRGCTACHSIEVEGGAPGPDLRKWSGLTNPIVWAQRMWAHTPTVQAGQEGSTEPRTMLQGADLAHLVAYVRQAGRHQERTYLRPGSIAIGQRLFADKKCNMCHPGTGPDLAMADLPLAVGVLAARMWKHSPEMSEVMRGEAGPGAPLSPQELADTLAYVLSLDRRERVADPLRGKREFERKTCSQCHAGRPAEGVDAPTIGHLRGSAESAAGVAAAMWNHGEIMPKRVEEVGVSWPVFDDGEMVDLLAWLRTQGKAEPQGTSAPAAGGDGNR
ncbi:MAG: c-type cytochrome [Phycisphaerae bacterium]